MSQKAATTPRDRLFETAARLFYQHGYRAVGVDMIAAESGIGKMTLYRHYASKETLILAFLRASNEEFWEYFEQFTGGAETGTAALLAFFDGLQAYTTSPACLGCPFINVIAEYPDPEHPIHQLALQHKRDVRTHFLSMATHAGAADPEGLANALMLLMDGAYTAARMFGPGPENPAQSVAATAEIVIAAATQPSLLS